MAVQLKLKEIVAANQFASNRMIEVEDMTEDELKAIRKYYCKLKAMSENEESLQKSHSIEEEEIRHEMKKDKPANKNKQPPIKMSKVIF